MERRSYATFRKVWPEKDLCVTSPQRVAGRLSAPTTHTARSRATTSSASWSAIYSGYGVYPERGFQIPQEIPDDVWQAYEELVEAGYDKYLLKD